MGATDYFLKIHSAAKKCKEQGKMPVISLGLFDLAVMPSGPKKDRIEHMVVAFLNDVNGFELNGQTGIFSLCFPQGRYSDIGTVGVTNYHQHLLHSRGLDRFHIDAYRNGEEHGWEPEIIARLIGETEKMIDDGRPIEISLASEDFIAFLEEYYAHAVPEAGPLPTAPAFEM
jgi:hypothetical protein